MNIINPFILPIYQKKLDNNIFNIISEQVYSYINKNREYFKASWNCPTLSNFNLPLNSDKRFINDNLNTELQKCTLDYIKEWGFIFNDFSPNFLISEQWINISPPGAYQEIHHHTAPPNSETNFYPLFSGVFYVDVKENSGDLVLKSPVSQDLSNIPLTPKHKNKFNITPNNQNIILFPSFLEHLVSQNQSNQDRISISFNINYTTK